MSARIIPPLEELETLPTTKSEARRKNASYYFTGAPCKYGHLDLRYTTSGQCASCQLELSRRWRARHPTKRRALHDRYREAHPETIKRARDNFRKNNPDKVLADCNKRRAQKVQATPRWANQKKIRLIYKEALELTKTTGTQYHVDHIIPLVHEDVCGLHCEANLRIIPAEKNLRKNNRY